jgi:hypothetical protein
MSYKNAFELQVQVNGRSTKEYTHNNVTYIEGRRNSRYTLKLKNHTATRALAVISVDGVDVLKGKPAEETNSGYIIDAHSTIEIKGYRVDDNNVAKFVFDEGKNSYSTHTTNTSQNVGVIGVRFFEEKEQPAAPIVIEKHIHHHPAPEPIKPWQQPWKPYDPFYPTWNNSGISYTGQSDQTTYCGGDSLGFTEDGITPKGMMKSSARGFSGELSGQVSARNMMGLAPTAAAPSEIPKFDLGTSWGEKVSDKVRTVEFKKGALAAQIELYYSSRKSLEKIGIDLDERQAVSEPSLPKAFGTSSYCRPPTNWRG